MDTLILKILLKLFLTIIFLNISIYANTINLAVASNVSYAINDLINEFNKKYKNIRVKVTLGSSGSLSAQIQHQAPYHIFLSANMMYPQVLHKNNHTITKPRVYAKGELAYFSTKKKDFSQGIMLLKNTTIKKIAIGNPKTAPYGKAAISAIKNANIYTDIKNKFVYAQSISQTLSYSIISTDIGLIAKSALYSKHMKKYKKNTNWLEVDDKLYTQINQGIVLLNKAKNNLAAKEFYDFMFTKNAKNILKTYGYKVL